MYVVRLKLPHVEGDDRFLFDMNRLVVRIKRRKWYWRREEPYEFKTLGDAIRAARSGFAKNKKSSGYMVEVVRSADGAIMWPKNVLDKLAEVIDDVEKSTSGETINDAIAAGGRKA